MSRILIEPNPTFNKSLNTEKGKGWYLDIAEMFDQTIQGEGINVGSPAVFLRLQGCTLNCVYCDTRMIKNEGNPFTFNELFDLMVYYKVIDSLSEGHHLVVTGGSPLLQQERLCLFFEFFRSEFQFLPYIEIENECTIMPSKELIPFISAWNNSPKLANSANSLWDRYKPDVIRELASLKNSWFKFVVDQESDIYEINKIVEFSHILNEQVMLMPKGKTRAEVLQNSEITINLAIKHGYRYCPREHIVIWDGKNSL